MNSLSPATNDGAMRNAMRARLTAKTATAQDCLRYSLARGWSGWMGFRPWTNPKYLHEGAEPAAGFIRATGQRHGHKLHPELETTLSAVARASVLKDRIELSTAAFRAAQKEQVALPVLKGYLRRAMMRTPQGKGNVWGHCVQTRKCVTALTLVLAGFGKRESLPAWVPDWYFNTPALHLTREQKADLFVYLEHHDCGKPFVYQEDPDGRVHFPEHAKMSAAIWAEVGGSERQQRLMLRDMDVHLMRAEDVPAFARDPDAPILLTAALASLWANAEDFGGTESTSFKAKLKHIDRRGRALCKIWQTEQLLATAA